MRTCKKKEMKICIVSSVGGHLTEIMALREVYEKYSHFYVFNDQIQFDNNAAIYQITHAERDLKILKNFLEVFKILLRERPSVILSAGAGPIIPFAIVGKYFFGCRIIYIETFTSVVSPTLTGRLMYKLNLANLFFYQWPELKVHFPNAVYSGLIF